LGTRLPRVRWGNRPPAPAATRRAPPQRAVVEAGEDGAGPPPSGRPDRPGWTSRSLLCHSSNGRNGIPRRRWANDGRPLPPRLQARRSAASHCCSTREDSTSRLRGGSVEHPAICSLSIAPGETSQSLVDAGMGSRARFVEGPVGRGARGPEAGSSKRAPPLDTIDRPRNARGGPSGMS